MEQRFHTLPTQYVRAVSMINLPNQHALALGQDGKVYSWRQYMGLWFSTANSEADWFDLGLRACAESNGRAIIRNGRFNIRTARRGTDNSN